MLSIMDHLNWQTIAQSINDYLSNNERVQTRSFTVLSRPGGGGLSAANQSLPAGYVCWLAVFFFFFLELLEVLEQR